jgi:hypothetical protein
VRLDGVPMETLGIRVVPFIARLVVVLAVALTSCRDPSENSGDALPNVRLGMAPRDVRDRFQPGGEGSWQTALGAGDDTVLEWTSKDPKSSVASARFEFHLAMLVAIRARTKGEAPRDELVSLTPRTVTVRSKANDGGTSITVLARDCPTHKDEAEAFALRGR